MAVITISRQVAALGDEIAKSLAEKKGYRFVDRTQIEKRIVQLGFPSGKLADYDERKPGFFASLSRDRDDYLNYLQCAVYEEAVKGNCILIGRGTFVILNELPNLVTLRFIADDKIRLQRLQKEFNWTESQARNRISESDSNRLGFHKSFFNLKNEEPQNFHLVLNTGILSIEQSVNVIESLVENCVDSEKEAGGSKRAAELLKCQQLVNRMIYEYKVPVNFLRVKMKDQTVTLCGAADSETSVRKAVDSASEICPDCKILSEISLIQNYKV